MPNLKTYTIATAVTVGAIELNILWNDILPHINGLESIDISDNGLQFTVVGASFVSEVNCDAAVLAHAGNTILSSWSPPSLALGSLIASGATFFVNTSGAGIYLSFSGGAFDDTVYFNRTLTAADGKLYPGVNLAVKLHCKISSNGSGGDTVGLICTHHLTKVGTNSSTGATTATQLDVDVSTELANIDFTIILPTIIGVVDAEKLLYTITRNSTGSGQDTYAGNLRVMGIEIIKV